MKNLRELKLVTPFAPPLQPRQGLTTALFWLGVFAVVLHVGLSAFPGIGTAGIPVNPASMVVLMGAAYGLAGGAVPFLQRCKSAPGLMLFVFSVPLFALYGSAMNSAGAPGFYLDGFWAPALLALLLQPATDQQKRTLCRILVALATVISTIALATHADPGEGAGSPTTQLIVVMECFALYCMRPHLILAAPLFMAFMLALLVGGGHIALEVTLLVSALAGACLFIAGIIKRDLNPNFVLVVGAALVVLPVLILFAATETSIIDRIVNAWHADDGAELPASQWAVLQVLTLKHWLFGLPTGDLEALKYQVGLTGIEGIQNVWLLSFLHLGAILFAVFVVSVGGFLIHIARAGKSPFAWLLVLAVLLIDVNSKQSGTDLFIEVAFLISMSGYATYDRRRPAVFHRPAPRPSDDRALAAFPIRPQRDPGLLKLAARPAPR
jgi:hypothetical protein